MQNLTIQVERRDDDPRVAQIDEWETELRALHARAEKLTQDINITRLTIDLETWTEDEWAESLDAPEDVQPQDAWMYDHEWVDEIPIDRYREFFISHLNAYSIQELRQLWTETRDP